MMLPFDTTAMLIWAKIARMGQINGLAPLILLEMDHLSIKIHGMVCLSLCAFLTGLAHPGMGPVSFLVHNGPLLYNRLALHGITIMLGVDRPALGMHLATLLVLWPK